MGAADLVAGSERVLWRLWHRALDLLLLALVLIACFLLMSLLAGSDHPVFSVVDLDQGPIGPQLTAAILRSPDFHLSTGGAGEMEDALRAANVDAYLVFPPDFSARLAREQVLRPEIHVAAGLGDPDAVLAAFSRTLLSSSGGTGQQIQPRISYSAGRSLPAHSYTVVGGLGLTIFFFALILPGIALDSRSQERSLSTVAGTVAACTLVSLIFGLVLFVLYRAALRLPSLSPTATVALVTLLGAAAATLLGTVIQLARLSITRLSWMIPLIILPQLLLAGLAFPLNAQPFVVRAVSSILPLTATIDGFRASMLRASGLTSTVLERDLASLLGFGLLAFGLLSVLVKGGRASTRT